MTVHAVHQRIYGKEISCSKVGCVVRTNTPCTNTSNTRFIVFDQRISRVVMDGLEIL